MDISAKEILYFNIILVDFKSTSTYTSNLTFYAFKIYFPFNNFFESIELFKLIQRHKSAGTIKVLWT